MPAFLTSMNRILGVLALSGMAACSSEEPPADFDAALALSEEDVREFLVLLSDVIDIDELTITLLTDFADVLPRYNAFTEVLPVGFDDRTVEIAYTNAKNPSGEIRLTIRSRDFALVEAACRQMRKFAARSDGVRSLTDCDSTHLETIDSEG